MNTSGGLINETKFQIGCWPSYTYHIEFTPWFLLLKDKAVCYTAAIVSYLILFLFYLMDIFYILGDYYLYDYLKKNKNEMKWLNRICNHSNNNW
jgi:hypothetical protein